MRWFDLELVYGLSFNDFSEATLSQVVRMLECLPI